MFRKLKRVFAMCYVVVGTVVSKDATELLINKPLLLHLVGHLSIYISILFISDHLCGLVVRVSGYRYRGLGFDSRRYQIF